MLVRRSACGVEFVTGGFVRRLHGRIQRLASCRRVLRQNRALDAALGLPGSTLHKLFPTFIYSGALQNAARNRFNRQLLAECRQLRHDDATGRRWSAEEIIPAATPPTGRCIGCSAFRRPSRRWKTNSRHVAAFAKAVEWDLDGRELKMTDCWINIMPRHVVHGLHLHPLSTLSGTYYVHVPPGTPGIKFEDPRLDRCRGANARRAGQTKRRDTAVGNISHNRGGTAAALQGLAAARSGAQPTSMPSASASASITTGSRRRQRPARNRVNSNHHDD